MGHLETIERSLEELRLRFPKTAVSAEVPQGHAAKDLQGRDVQDALADEEAEEPAAIQLFDPRKTQASEPTSGSERSESHRNGIRERLKRSGSLRLLGAVVTDALMERLEQLKGTHPNFDEVTEFVMCEAALQVRRHRSICGLRIELEGPPGVGKTDYAQELSAALAVPMEVISMSATQAGAHLGGSDEYWSNTKPGTVFDCLIDGRIANPIFVLDELDKVAARSDGSPVGALYQLLEERTAKAFRDRSVPWLPIDASHVNWIVTANDTAHIEEALQSRFHVFHVEAPQDSQADAITQEIYLRLLEGLSLLDRFPIELPLQMLTKLRGQSARAIKKQLRQALAMALRYHQDAIRLADIPPPKVSRPRMGFITTGQ